MLNRGLSVEPAMESELISEGPDMLAKDRTQIFSVFHKYELIYIQAHPVLILSIYKT